eukprot:gene1348-2600_t
MESFVNELQIEHEILVKGIKTIDNIFEQGGLDTTEAFTAKTRIRQCYYSKKLYLLNQIEGYQAFLILYNQVFLKKEKSYRPVIIFEWIYSNIVALVYFSVGVLFAMVLTNWRDGKKQQTNTTPDMARKLYLNFTVLNKHDVVMNVVKSKFSSSMVGSIAGRVANSVINDENFSERVGERLVSLIPEKLDELGVKASVELIFLWDTNFIVELRIIDANIKKILAMKMGKENIQYLEKIAQAVGGDDHTEALFTSMNRTAALKVSEKLNLLMADKIREKMAEKGLEVQVQCCSESEQTAVLVSTLQKLGVGQRKTIEKDR